MTTTLDPPVTSPEAGSAPRAMAASSGRAHLSAAERAARGKATRRLAPRSGLSVWEPSADRSDPVDVLEAQSATRVPELMPIRYGRMVASPFTFFRGTAAIMAADLASTPTSGLRVQACGDAHLSNFGLFASPERKLVFEGLDDDTLVEDSMDALLVVVTAGTAPRLPAGVV